MRKSFSLFALLLLTGVGLAETRTPIFRPGALSGVLVGADGVSPISDIAVELYRADGDKVDARQTDDEGAFRFADVEVGSYLVRVGRAQVPVRVKTELEGDEAFAADLLISVPASWAVAVLPEGETPVTVELFLPAQQLQVGSLLQSEWTGTETAIALGAGGAVLIGGGTAAVIIILNNQDSSSSGSAAAAPPPVSPFRP